MSADHSEDCHHSVAVEGRTYTCKLHAGHRFQHRARVTADRTVSVGRLEHGAEIVWPNTQENPHG